MQTCRPSPAPFFAYDFVRNGSSPGEYIVVPPPRIPPGAAAGRRLAEVSAAAAVPLDSALTLGDTVYYVPAANGTIDAQTLYNDFYTAYNTEGVIAFVFPYGTWTVINPVDGFHMLFSCNGVSLPPFTIDFGGADYIFTARVPARLRRATRMPSGMSTRQVSTTAVATPPCACSRFTLCMKQPMAAVCMPLQSSRCHERHAHAALLAACAGQHPGRCLLQLLQQHHGHQRHLLLPLQREPLVPGHRHQHLHRRPHLDHRGDTCLPHAPTSVPSAPSHARSHCARSRFWRMEPERAGMPCRGSCSGTPVAGCKRECQAC